MKFTEYRHEIRERGDHGLDAVIPVPHGELIAGLATQTSRGPWTVTLFDGPDGDVSATARDRADALALMDFHASLLVRLMTSEQVTA